MSYATVIAAAAALKDVNDRIDALQDEKNTLQARIVVINADIATLRTERDTRTATLKTEAGTI
jgi:hypothetical protein